MSWAIVMAMQAFDAGNTPLRNWGVMGVGCGGDLRAGEVAAGSECFGSKLGIKVGRFIEHARQFFEKLGFSKTEVIHFAVDCIFKAADGKQSCMRDSNLSIDNHRASNMFCLVFSEDSCFLGVNAMPISSND